MSAAMKSFSASGVVLLAALGCAGGQRAAPASSGSSGRATSASETTQATQARTMVYVGLASGEVTAFQLDLATGGLGRRGTVAVGRAPSALARSSEREVLVAVDEATGMAASLAINPKTGVLTQVSRVATGGAQPSAVTVDATGKYALTANSGSDSVSMLAIKPSGALDAAETFAAGGGAHAIAVHPANQVAFVTNFRAGTVSQYTFNTGTGVLTPKPGPPLALPAGSGPTRLVCHPSGRWVYLLNETKDAVSVHVFDEDIKALSSMASQIISTLPAGVSGAKNRPTDLALGRAGRFLYASNRGHDSVATFRVDPGGTLALMGHEGSGGRAPAALAVDPTGAFLLVANHDSKSVVVFRLDPETGVPHAVHTVALDAAPLALLAAQL
jgi:6-phosphogluconolactonase